MKESEFLLARKKVQLVRTELEEEQETLNMTRKQLDRTDRANENYLNFVANEHKILLQGKLWICSDVMVPYRSGTKRSYSIGSFFNAD